MTSAQIRQAFIEFFVQKHGHTAVPSSPVVPLNDPTLLFTNAGMNQFKPIFLGQEKRDYTRAVDTQKCIRAGGKHNDLDDVGRSRRHHTFFEMLGNWSFGDYFKQGAIEMSWELLTKVWKLDPTRLHVTCYEGDPQNGVPRDTEAADIWRRVANWEQYGHKSDDHIHYFGKDNFWEMGDTGPCGPCTEIYYDRTEDKSGKSLVNGEDPRVMEIWNNVFIQYNRNLDRSLVTLPSQHVDTGMGFERICQVLQNVGSNYDIDLFDPYWAKLKELSGKTYTGKFPKTNAADPAAEAADAQLRYDIAFRVIADHIRCLTFALTDGATPGNEGRGYVLRRILRRAVRFGRQQLELKDPFLYKLVEVVVSSMGDAFPELKKNPEHVKELIKDEEISFGRTLERGIALFEDELGDLYGETYAKELGIVYSNSSSRVQNKIGNEAEMMLSFREAESDPIEKSFDLSIDKVEKELLQRKVVLPEFPAHAAFMLHDTFGFPIDLTQIMAAERGMSVDYEGYERLMEEARAKARAGGKSGDDIVYDLTPDALSQLEQEGVARTDDSFKYEGKPVQARIVAIWRGDELVSETPPGKDIGIVLDKTPFYADMGGQVGDEGPIELLTPSPGIPGEGRGEGKSGDNALTPTLSRNTGRGSESFEVFDTHDSGGYIVHIGRVSGGTLKVGETVTASLAPSRHPTQQNHTATHVANWALREVLGESVQQKGSLVDSHKLRFDFSHGKSLTEEEIGRVEHLVNHQITQKFPVYAEEAPQSDAMKINGLRAVFGEKYPPMVRVVSIGARVADLLKDPSKNDWRNYSIEFCGGTHLKNTSEIEKFTIISEESVSKGVRRIVAFTGAAAAASLKIEHDLNTAIESAKHAKESEIPTIITALQRQAGAEGMPQLAKRRLQAFIPELQAKFKAWEKSQKQSGAGINAGAVADELIAKADKGLILTIIENASEDELRSVVDSIKSKQKTFAVMICAKSAEKFSFVAGVSEDLIKKGLKAGDWVRETSKITGGGGGGRPNLAMGSGKDAAKIDEALAAAKEIATKVL